MQVRPAGRMLLDFGGAPEPSALSVPIAKEASRQCQICPSREERDAATAAAHERGLAEGREHGRSERSRSEAQIEEDRRAENVAGLTALTVELFARVDDGLASVHAEIAQTAAQLLGTFFQERIKLETVDRLARELRATLADSTKPRVIVRGPQAWIDLVLTMLPVGETAPVVELLPDPAVDVQIIVGQTSVATALAAWVSRIEADR